MSLFAQELKTPTPVSTKRLQKNLVVLCVADRPKFSPQRHREPQSPECLRCRWGSLPGQIADTDKGRRCSLCHRGSNPTF